MRARPGDLKRNAFNPRFSALRVGNARRTAHPYFEGVSRQRTHAAHRQSCEGGLRVQSSVRRSFPVEPQGGPPTFPERPQGGSPFHVMSLLWAVDFGECELAPLTATLPLAFQGPASRSGHRLAGAS